MSTIIYILVAPQIQASGITLALLGDRVDLKCTVKAKPAPKVIFWRDHEGRVPVIVGKNYEMTMEASNTVSSDFFFVPTLIDAILKVSIYLSLKSLTLSRTYLHLQ